MEHKIKTFEDACEALGIKPELPGVSMLPEKHQKAIVAHYKLVIIAEALNEGWKPDWENNQWDKYYPWFYMKSGVGFSFSDNVIWGTFTDAGSRLCFKSSELAKYAGTQFLDLYRESFMFE